MSAVPAATVSPSAPAADSRHHRGFRQPGGNDVVRLEGTTSPHFAAVSAAMRGKNGADGC